MPLFTAIIANTIDATPLNPAHDTRRHWFMLDLNGRSNTKIATGRAMNVRNINISVPVDSREGTLLGKARSPKIKKIAIWLNFVIPSKKFISANLFFMFALPRMIPRK